MVYNETGGDLNNLNNEWNHEDIVKELKRKEDRIDTVSSEVVRIQKKDKLEHIDLESTEIMDKICKREEIVQNLGSKEDRIDTVSSEVVKIHKKDEIEELEIEFYKKGDFYGAKI